MGGMVALGAPMGTLKQWSACVRRKGLMPLSLTNGADHGSPDDFLYCLYGMY